MDSFGSDFSAGGSGGKIDTGTIMEQVKVQIAVANAQELLQRMTDKCFKKCIGKPGSSLDNSEQKCIAMCMDRYMDAWNTVSRTYNSRLQRERARMWWSSTWVHSFVFWYKYYGDTEYHTAAPISPQLDITGSHDPSPWIFVWVLPHVLLRNTLSLSSNIFFNRVKKISCTTLKSGVNKHKLAYCDKLYLIPCWFQWFQEK